MQLRSRVLALMLVPVVLVAAGCGSDSKTASTAVPMLSGVTYVATAITGATQAPGSTIELAFGTDGTLSVNAGCNVMNSPYTLAGNVLKISAFAGTKKACDPALMAQDDFVAALLTSSPTVAAGGTNQIAITGTSGSMTLQDAKTMSTATPTS